MVRLSRAIILTLSLSLAQVCSGFRKQLPDDRALKDHQDSKIQEESLEQVKEVKQEGENDSTEDVASEKEYGSQVEEDDEALLEREDDEALLEREDDELPEEDDGDEMDEALLELEREDNELSEEDDDGDDALLELEREDDELVAGLEANQTRSGPPRAIPGEECARDDDASFHSSFCQRHASRHSSGCRYIDVQELTCRGGPNIRINCNLAAWQEYCQTTCASTLRCIPPTEHRRRQPRRAPRPPVTGESREYFPKNGIYKIRQFTKNKKRGCKQPLLDAFTRSSADWAAATTREGRGGKVFDNQKWIVTNVILGNGIKGIRIQQLSTKRYLDAYDNGAKDWSVVTRTMQMNPSQLWVGEKVKMRRHRLGDDSCDKAGTYRDERWGTRLKQRSSGRFLQAHVYRHKTKGYKAMTRPAASSSKWYENEKDMEEEYWSQFWDFYKVADHPKERRATRPGSNTKG